jgi:hypothetical protein
MFDSSKPFQHPDTLSADDETLERDARTHLAKSPHLQVMAELVAKLRASNFAWWSATFTRSQWRALPRMQWLAERPDLRQKITSHLTGLPRKAARSKTPEFQAALIDAVLDHGDISGIEFEQTFAPQDLVTYGPVSEMWEQFRQRMPWGDDNESHQKFMGWLLKVLLSERSTLDPDMLRKPILTAWDVRTAINPHVWQERIPAELRASIDEARLKREKSRPREPYCARHELQIATPDLLAQYIPLGDLLPVVHVAEQALFAPQESVVAESGSFQTVPVSRSMVGPAPNSQSVVSGLPTPPSRTSSVNALTAVNSTRPFAVAR